MTGKVLLKQNGGILTLTLNWPETRNALTDEALLDPFADALMQIAGDASVRVLIITGSDPAFSSGGNLKDVHQRRGSFAGNSNDIREGYRRGVQRIPRLLYDLDIPTIAAVNGPAMGAGCDLVTMCDLRIASDKAVFCQTFVSLGLIPGDGGAWLLPRAIGQARAAEMMFTADPIDATTAAEWGLVSRVVAHDQLLATAENLAARIARHGSPGLRLAKRLLREGQRLDLPSLLEMSAAFQAVAHDTPEHDQAIEDAVRRLGQKKAPQTP
jgi:enoyl-CoA hydratase/carnithine racemase